MCEGSFGAPGRLHCLLLVGTHTPSIPFPNTLSVSAAARRGGGAARRSCSTTSLNWIERLRWNWACCPWVLPRCWRGVDYVSILPATKHAHSGVHTTCSVPLMAVSNSSARNVYSIAKPPATSGGRYAVTVGITHFESCGSLASVNQITRRSPFKSYSGPCRAGRGAFACTVWGST